MTLLLASCTRDKDVCDPDDTGYPVGDDGEVIDVLIIYTSEALDAELSTCDGTLSSDEAEVAWSEHLISHANEAMANSGVSHRFATAATYAMTQSQSSWLGDLPATVDGDSTADWADVRKFRYLARNDSDIETMRDNHDADIVAVLVAPSDDSSGIAGISRGDNVLEVGSAFAAVDVTLTSSFVHELGHIVGAEHDEDAENPPSPDVDYGKGWLMDSIGARTVMAYPTGCSSDCERVYYFSNPHKTLDGVDVGDEDDAYNACVIEQLGGYVAEFSDYIDGGTLTSVILDTVCTDVL